ncbi:glycosyltransferase family 2 protein [Prochlorococcus marinus XMU1411]|uniref:glycosyltransferase family 2 protein n=1 Tax=Prochlorococcus marinus TaxID=1219 RepID=UPI001AD9E568|nr:glycosyltransferase family 2 protein [Prochlorococcus marinus]MBO8244243.1 glycosyltransferase family 2 protein [Prochlorococcus marinus XMU1411]MBW3055329.1 hypothetical protein [Prochlorococcus marinus str. MU1411]MCR8537071.1 glycosyltransferase family 2 protein [Prochlorococcus marinus CUG1430]
MKIDCLITTFNDEKVINKCIESIPKKILGLPVRIIISDDFSKDKTIEIARNLLKGREHKIITSESNKGVGKNRQIALEAVSSDYFFFIDSDDYLKESNFTIEQEEYFLKSDMIFFSKLVPYRNSQVNFEKEILQISDQINKEINIDILYFLICKYKLRMGECWGVIFKNSIIKKYSIQFIDAIVGEDVIFLLEYLLKSKTWSFYPKIVLHKTYNLGLSSYIGDSVTKSYLRILNKSFSLLQFEKNKLISKTKIDLYKFYQDSFIRSVAIHNFFSKNSTIDNIKECKINSIYKNIFKNNLNNEIDIKIDRLSQDLELCLKKIIDSDKNIKYCFWLASPLTFVFSRLLFLKHNIKVSVILDDARNGTYNLSNQDFIPIMKLDEFSLKEKFNFRFIIINQSETLIKKLTNKTLLKYPSSEVIEMVF